MLSSVTTKLPPPPPAPPEAVLTPPSCPTRIFKTSPRLRWKFPFTRAPRPRLLAVGLQQNLGLGKIMMDVDYEGFGLGLRKFKRRLKLLVLDK